MRIPKVCVCLALLTVVGLVATAQARTLFENGQTYVTSESTPVTYDVNSAGRGYLVDNGTIPDGSGWIVSGWNTWLNGFMQFQAFTVTDPEGWIVDTIGIDGCVWSDPDGLGLVGTVFPDDNGSPDETTPLGSATYWLAGDPFGSNWRDEAFGITLPQGAYWFRYEAGGPNYDSFIFNGVSGEGAFSRRGEDGAEFPHGPLAFRIYGEVVPEPGALFLLLVGAGAALRRR